MAQAFVADNFTLLHGGDGAPEQQPAQLPRGPYNELAVHQSPRSLAGVGLYSTTTYYAGVAKQLREAQIHLTGLVKRTDGSYLKHWVAHVERLFRDYQCESPITALRCIMSRSNEKSDAR